MYECKWQKVAWHVTQGWTKEPVYPTFADWLQWFGSSHYPHNSRLDKVILVSSSLGSVLLRSYYSKLKISCWYTDVFADDVCHSVSDCFCSGQQHKRLQDSFFFKLFYTCIYFLNFIKKGNFVTRSSAPFQHKARDTPECVHDNF